MLYINVNSISCFYSVASHSSFIQTKFQEIIKTELYKYWYLIFKKTVYKN